MMKDKQTQITGEQFEEEVLYSIFYGNNSFYYLNCLEKIKIGKKLIFNLYAFVFSILWLAYRKMYLEFAISLLIGISLAIFIGISLSIFTLSLILGLTGNYLYVKKSIREMQKAQANYPNLNDRMDYLRRAGGTNYNIVFTFIGLFILISLLTFAILAYIIGHKAI